ncbi:uncharacterized protein LOC115999571 [Ipomoea triloba]|uniref:uncharacterized protein LOC115999571 n=1 Tax=Ipomoea triloba TaxID=35885 RepID=UPI00125DAC66|nr:uncharacterized protein LOC115999571 [Ipomoea triloba]
MKWAAVCWCVWKGRNEVIWNNVAWSVTSETASFNSSGFFVTAPITTVVSPVDNVLKVYVDAAVFPDIRRAFYGVVVNDGHGVFVAATNGHLQCLADPHLAEALAIKEALSWCKDINFARISIFSDCQIVCNLFNGSLPDHSYAGCVINECRTLKRHFEVVSLQFIQQSTNKLAHALARAARSQSDSSSWFSSIPLCIENFY